jgi:hypothetical protein
LTSYLWYAGFITSDPLSKLHFIWFHPLFSRLGQKHSFTWGPYAAFHGMAQRCHIEGSMITAVWTHLRMFLNSKFRHFCVKCWILLKPVLGRVDGSLHFPVPPMNRLNQTEPATFSILLRWTFFRDSVFLYFKVNYGNIRGGWRHGLLTILFGFGIYRINHILGKYLPFPIEQNFP